MSRLSRRLRALGLAPPLARLGFALLTLLTGLAGSPAAAAASPCPIEAPCRVSGPFGDGEYLIALPQGAAEGPFPALIMLHGWGGRAEAVIRSPRQAGEWLTLGWAVVAPQGLPRAAGDPGGRWDAQGADGARDDLGFVLAVAEDARTRAPLDPARLVLGGFSLGGMMTWRVACQAPESFAAFLPVAGLLWRPLPASCAGPAPMLHIHGWSDEVVPIEGRAVASGRLTQGDLFQGLALMRAANGCASDAPDETRIAPPFRLRLWRACAGAPLAFALHDRGHQTPEGWAALARGWLAPLLRLKDPE